jgi:hypothetical protein
MALSSVFIARGRARAAPREKGGKRRSAGGWTLLSRLLLRRVRREPISTPRTPALVPLPFREPAEGYEADDGDDDAEQDAPDQRNATTIPAMTRMPPGPIPPQRPDPRVSVGVESSIAPFIV